jgi:type I restriction enzyme, R subunit
VDTSEKNFETTIEQSLVSQGWRRRKPKDYNAQLGLDVECLIDFIQATQPETWKRYVEQYGAEARPSFAQRAAKEIRSRGAVEVLRNGIKDRGCHFHIACFRPVSGLNEELAKLFAGNQISIVRQFPFSEKTNQTIDLALFLNGIPIFTVELKNQAKGQDVWDGMRQYRKREEREPIFALGRCLAHFAVDTRDAYVTTHVRGEKTRFLPFNRGFEKGAGNPPSRTGFATDYLWKDIWTRESVLELIQHFVHDVEEVSTDTAGRTRRERKLLFPRYHQRDAVRSLVAHAREHGVGGRYLIQHSAGSGKSNSIAWLAHQLSTLHDAGDRPVFDSVLVITDRKILDRQLQRTVGQFQKVLGVVENIDTTSRQKFPVIEQQVRALGDRRFAVIIDEAHSSQAGESARSVKKVLSAATLEEAENEEGGEEETLEDRIAAEMEARGPAPNVSLFAFTATPKQKTLELFGVKRPDGGFDPFSLYSMRQAIEEKFILDVLKNYTTYDAYWKLRKKIEDDPRYQRKKAKRLLKSFVEQHDVAIRQKVEVIVDHFEEHVRRRIRSRAKAMIVTRSRLHAVRYGLALRRRLEEIGAPYKVMVAFSGTVKDGDKEYTEFSLNGVAESHTAEEFRKDENRFLVVANKFQTGFDEPLLAAMYVDKKLSGVATVQTLSRLNRIHPDKEETFVLDFANDAGMVLEDFKTYYECTLLSESTDPNQLYDLQHQLEQFHLFTQDEVDCFAYVWFDPKASQEQLHPILAPIIGRYNDRTRDEQTAFRKLLQEFTRLYGFLSQILSFTDTSLEKLHVFARMLWRLLPVEREGLPREVLENVDMDSYRLQETHAGDIKLTRAGAHALDPISIASVVRETPEDPLEHLSRIIDDLNQTFGVNLTEADKVCIGEALRNLAIDSSLDASVRVNTRENAALTFDQRFGDAVEDFVESNFKLYKRINDNPEFRRALRDRLFDDYLAKKREADELIRLGEGKTVEYKATLCFDTETQQQSNEITFRVLKAIASFLNTDGGDLLIGVSDDGKPLGIDLDQFESHDKFIRHLTQLSINAFGKTAASRIDPRVQMVQGFPICRVACGRSAVPVFLKWKGFENSKEGDIYIRVGASDQRLEPGSELDAYLSTRFKQGSA